ncbi:M20/M25/M40 family metallo-hydrolase [Alteraurantiacibacter aquimixticola]|uniref:M20/M25/M40 family metallo-hydrolase n=1 Tax=Alteraurantiacibacter aquimixticola TaxID=2489173 RepID=A0A4T3F6N3_9SPHN|nr:M20/M25/M40 family metallo-hydrolase [Alteraurantiacibacter aquimixticola]TIX52114.1 M20/M25/M40 family metallo-hydrolase [Alteraurantiacibacter aquimixticola]
MICLAGLLATVSASPAIAQARDFTSQEQRVVDLTSAAISLRSVRGEGNETGKVAELFRDALLYAGWSADEIEIVPVDDTAYFIATWQGRDASLGPIVLSAHMDVVEAKPEDWERDPFTPVLADGYLFGRGASDTKFDAVQAMVAVMELRQANFVPERSIVLAFSGDEETTMITSAMIAERLRDAQLVLNVDGASGTLDEETGEPSYWSWQGAEKTYADFELEVTNPGGHSSAPRDDNAIVQLSAALARIGAHRFTPELNDITRDYFTKAAQFESDPLLAAAMRAFAADPADKAAVAVLRGNPAYIGRIGTTCVPTQVEAGHALNALPQRATAYVNCRIFPGHPKEEIMAELSRVADEPAMTIREINPEYVVAAPASPYDAEFVGAVTRAIHAAFGEVPVLASQSSGASDSMWYRALGVPSYGASGTFMRESDEYAHGLNERVPLANIGRSLEYYRVLLTELASQ